MYRIVTAAVLGILLTLASIGAAHEQSLHKGKPVEGEVTTVAGDTLTLETGATTLAVVLDDKTKFERGDQPAERSDVKRGVHLTIFGTRLATGELVAREVLIAGNHSEGMSEHTGHEMPSGQRR